MNPNSSLSADELRQVSGSLKRAHMSDHLATAVFYVVSGAFVLLLIAFAMYVVWGGIKAFRPEIFSFDANGIGNQFFNTVYLVFLSLVISVPIGIFAGLYMAEYAPEGRIIHALRIAIETLSSLPSIVVGLFGFQTHAILQTGTAAAGNGQPQTGNRGGGTANETLNGLFGGGGQCNHGKSPGWL